MTLTPEQQTKRLKNYCSKNNFHLDIDDVIYMFKNLEDNTLVTFNKFIKSEYKD